MNNRAPKFNQENYNVVDVSKTLPVGLKLDILNLYGIEAWVQDIDIKFELPDGAQIDDNITLTITGNIYRKVASIRPGYYSILNSFGQRSHYISIKFALHK